MTGPAHILLFQERPEPSGGVRDRLAKEGFEVAWARSFVEAVPHLAAGRVNLVLVYLPETEFVRNTFLSETRQAAPALPIVALAELVTDELRRLLARFGVAAVLPARTPWREVLRTIRETLAAEQEALTSSNTQPRSNP